MHKPHLSELDRSTDRCFDRTMADTDEITESPNQGTVPLLDFCPSCGSPLDGQKCKVYCPNQGCALYRRIIENCAGD